MQAAQATLRQSMRWIVHIQSVTDASRTGYAEAKMMSFGRMDSP